MTFEKAILIMKHSYTKACSAAGIQPIDNFEYNIATGCGDEYISQLEATKNSECITVANQIATLVSRI